MKKIIYLILFMLVVGLSQGLFAQSQRIGSAGASELLISTSARGVAMGEAAVTSSAGIDAMYWNPANVALSTSGVDIVASNRTHIADINLLNFGLGINAGGFGHIGLSIKSLSMNPILKTTVQNPDGTGQTFKPSHVIIGANWSKQIVEQISVGFNVNYISEEIDLVSATGFGFDFGVNYADLGNIKGLDMAVVLRNFGADMKFDGSALWTLATANEQRRGEQYYKVDAASFSLPTSFDIALGYGLDFAASSLQLNAVYTNNNFYTDQYKLGAEYAFNNMVFVRGGYIYTSDYDAANVVYKYSFGAGLNLDFGGVDLKVDYAYLPAEFFSSNHLISLGLGI